MNETIFERMSVEGAKSALNGYKLLKSDLNQEEYELYEVCYEYWSKPENLELAKRVAKSK